MMKPLALALILLVGEHTASTAAFSYGHAPCRPKNMSNQTLHWSRRQNIVKFRSPSSTTTCFAEDEQKGGTARFVGLDGGTTSGLDYVLSLVSSDIGSTILGLVGLFVCVANRLVNTDSLSTETMGQETRADLLAVFSSGAVLLNGISKLDVTSALAESVVLDGETLSEPIYNSKVNRQQDMTWALESVLAATPAMTAVLLVAEEKGWSVESLAGVVPRDSSLRDAAPRETPILNRFRKDISKETYLPTLQALPGRVEFTYLPPNTQGALLLPVKSGLMVLVLGMNTTKSFSPRDVAWCQVLASRIGTFLQ
jgi:Cofactor assembly of complex C subunit B, CCB2/CCB4